MGDLKHCNRCGCDKPLDRDHWYWSRGRPNHLCKDCQRVEHKAYYAQNSASIRARNKEKRDTNIDAARTIERTYGATYRTANRAAINHRNRVAYAANPTPFAERRARHKEKDPSTYLRRAAAAARNARLRDVEAYRADRRRRAAAYTRDPTKRLNERVRAHVWYSLSRVDATKSQRTRHLVGWSVTDLLAHLSPLFEAGMSPQNYGEWHVDHVIPLAAFNFDSEDHPAFKAAWSLSNLAPLWAKDNLSKSDSLDWQLPDTYTNPLLRAMYDNRNYKLAAAA